MCLIFILAFLSFKLYAQEAETVRIYGNIKEAKTGEDAIGAYVKILQKGRQIGLTATDFEGNYSMPLPKGFYDIEVSYVGLKTKLVKNVIAIIDFSLDIKLEYNDLIIDSCCGCRGYKIPLTQQDYPSSGAIFSSEQLARMPK